MSTRLLIVDDDIEMANFVRLMFKRTEWEVLIATGGAEAVRLAQQVLPDLILLDLMMPGMNGFEVCTTLRADPRFKDTPILVFTASGSYVDHMRARAAGATDVALKGSGLAELRERATTLLNARAGSRMRAVGSAAALPLAARP
jgi:DNA-binding response OmpR family regulator